MPAWAWAIIVGVACLGLGMLCAWLILRKKPVAPTPVVDEVVDEVVGDIKKAGEEYKEGRDEHDKKVIVDLQTSSKDQAAAAKEVEDLTDDAVAERIDKVDQ